MQQRPSFAWLRIAAGLRKRCVELAAELGATLEEVAILACLEESGPMFHNDLATRVGIDKARLVPLASGLLGAHLISLDYDLPDRRRTQLKVTDVGEDLLRRFEVRLEQFEDRGFGPLGAAETELLRRLGARLLGAVSEV